MNMVFLVMAVVLHGGNATDVVSNILGPFKEERQCIAFQMEFQDKMTSRALAIAKSHEVDITAISFSCQTLSAV